MLWVLPTLSNGSGEVRIEGEAVRSLIIPGIVVPKKASTSSGSNTSSNRWWRPSKLQSYLSLYLVLYDIIACSSSLLEVIGDEVRALTTSCHLWGRELNLNSGQGLVPASQHLPSLLLLRIEIFFAPGQPHMLTVPHISQHSWMRGRNTARVL